MRPTGAASTTDATPVRQAGAVPSRAATVDKPRAQPAASSPAARASFTALLSPRRDGTTRVLLHSSDRNTLDALFGAEKHQDYRPSFGLNGDRLLWELHGEIGYRYAPFYGNSLAIEAGARIGYRLIRLGGGELHPEPSASFGLAAGLGGGWSTKDEKGYAMPSLTLSYLIRRVAEPIPGHLIPVGHELSLDLHTVGLLGTDRRALEGQLVFRYSDMLGIYVGAGYQWLPTKGATFTVGLYLSTIGMALAALIGAIALSS
ncbi:MAG: hypothetical protein RBU30_17785 [Polyangia bacterium]|nr:hypothetical protein [Polyangia bacterium]